MAFHLKTFLKFGQKKRPFCDLSRQTAHKIVSWSDGNICIKYDMECYKSFILCFVDISWIRQR